MARNVIPLYTTNQIITAAHGNTYWRDNEIAHWVGTTEGDVDYYSSATAKSRLAIGTAGQGLLTNAGATAPEWGTVIRELIAKRQGGGASDWHTVGTTNYTPSGSKIQVGVKLMTVVASVIENVTVTFPEAFTNIPLVILGAPRYTAGGLSPERAIAVSNPSTTTFKIYAAFDPAQTITLNHYWMAIGD